MQTIAVAALVVLGTFMRMLPHTPNMLPMSALALFAGAKIERAPIALCVVLLPMLLTDLVIGFHVTMPVVYLSLALTLWIGRGLARADAAVGKRGPAVAAGQIAGASLTSSLVFFVITNLGVFLFQDLYPRTLDGLLACFIAAIPFFQSSVVADLFYAAVFFGGAALIERFDNGYAAQRTNG